MIVVEFSRQAAKINHDHDLDGRRPSTLATARSGPGA
jgi:hypothetical protein